MNACLEPVAAPSSRLAARLDREEPTTSRGTQRFSVLVALFMVLLATFAHAAPRKASLSTDLNVDKLRPGDTVALAITLDIPQGLHAQSNKPLDESLIPTTVKITGGAKLLSVLYPDGHVENYPALGKVSVYSGKVTFLALLEVAKDASPGAAEIAGSVRYQMCDDKACFAPVTDKFTVKTTVAAPGDVVTENRTGHFADLDLKIKTLDITTTQPAAADDDTPPPAEDAEAGGPTSLLGAIGLALLVGVIFNVMPCVLPVLPLKAIGFYEASHHQRGRTMAFGLFFSLGVIAVFAILATLLLAGKSIIGFNIQWGQLFAYPAFVWPMVIILLLLGLWLLGAFGVNLPTGIYGLSFRHDTFTGNFMWGGLTAILSTPCTAPLFPPLLAWSASQPLASGFITLIFVGVGMALPYLVLSAFPELARKFPRTGPFAELFKQMMAFLLLGTAAFLLGTRVLGDPKQWWLVFGIAVASGVFLIVRTRQLMPSPRATTVAVALAVLLTGASFAWTRHLTQPSKGFIAYTPQAFEEARQSGDIVLVKFTASWCLNCKYVEQTVFHDDATLDALQARHVRLIKADLTDHDAPGWALLNELGQSGIPFTAVWPPKGDKPLTLGSIYTSPTLLATVDRATAGY